MPQNHLGYLGEADFWFYEIKSLGIVAGICIQAASHMLGAETTAWKAFSRHLSLTVCFKYFISQYYTWLGYKWLTMNP